MLTLFIAVVFRTIQFVDDEGDVCKVKDAGKGESGWTSTSYRYSRLNHIVSWVQTDKGVKWKSLRLR